MADSLSKILGEYKNILSDNASLDKEITELHARVDRRVEVCDKTPIILDNATEEFTSLTSIINKKDILSLFSL